LISSIAPKLRNRQPEKKKMFLALQNLSMIAPTPIATIMLQMKPRQPPKIMPITPYLAARDMAEI